MYIALHWTSEQEVELYRHCRQHDNQYNMQLQYTIIVLCVAKSSSTPLLCAHTLWPILQGVEFPLVTLCWLTTQLHNWYSLPRSLLIHKLINKLSGCRHNLTHLGTSTSVVLHRWWHQVILVLWCHGEGNSYSNFCQPGQNVIIQI